LEENLYFKEDFVFSQNFDYRANFIGLIGHTYCFARNEDFGLNFRGLSNYIYLPIIRVRNKDFG
jgi:hypothetical protein